MAVGSLVIWNERPMVLPFQCFRFAGPIACDKTLRNIVAWLGSVGVGTIFIQSNEMFCVATGTCKSYSFIDNVLPCAIFDRYQLDVVRVSATVCGTLGVVDALANCLC